MFGVVATVILFAAAAVVGATVASARARSLGVTPSTDLIDGQVVQVTGSHFAPSSLVGMAVCLVGATNASGCDVGHQVLIASDATGSFSQGFAVPREITLRTVATDDCAATACALGAN